MNDGRAIFTSTTPASTFPKITYKAGQVDTSVHLIPSSLSNHNCRISSYSQTQITVALFPIDSFTFQVNDEIQFILYASRLVGNVVNSKTISSTGTDPVPTYLGTAANAFRYTQTSTWNSNVRYDLQLNYNNVVNGDDSTEAIWVYSTVTASVTRNSQIISTLVFTDSHFYFNYHGMIDLADSSTTAVWAKQSNT